jgi:hypothetical protein
MKKPEENQNLLPSANEEPKPNYGMVFNKYQRRRPTRYSINWEEIEKAYVFAEPILHKETNSFRYPSLAEIGEQYGVSLASMAMMSSRSNPSWYEQRKLYHEKTRKLHDLEYGVMQLRRSSEFDSHNLRRLDKFSSIFDVWLEDLEDQICNKNSYRDEGDSSPPLGIKDMKEAMTVMKDMHKLNRDILGEPVNYYEFYKEKLKEERQAVEKGKAVTRDEIRDLISAVRKEDTADVTLDVSVDEETGMKRIEQREDDRA